MSAAWMAGYRTSFVVVAALTWAVNRGIEKAAGVVSRARLSQIICVIPLTLANAPLCHSPNSKLERCHESPGMEISDLLVHRTSRDGAAHRIRFYPLGANSWGDRCGGARR